MVYAQLMGMADHVSCELVAQGRAAEARTTQAAADADAVDAGQVERPRPYKYLVWGSLDECLKYLVRRAEENRDAMGRALEERQRLWAELKRRVFG
jgi:proline dehydrogenase